MKPFYLFISLSILFSSCGRNEPKIENTPPTIKPTISTNSNQNSNNSVSKIVDTLSSIENPKTIFLQLQTAKSKKHTIKKAKERSQPKSNTTKPEAVVSNHFESFVYFREMLAYTKNGTTLTQKELTQYDEVPKDVIKMIKSITKVSDNAIVIKWHSTWFVEKVSDAKFSDASLKFRFDKNKMYTSGKAIGIKYNKKMYNDLIIIGNSAYIPTVKGFHWQIGK